MQDFPPKCSERPLAVVVLKPGAEASPAELRGFLAPQFPKFCRTVRVHRRDPAHVSREVQEKRAARAVQGLSAGGVSPSSAIQVVQKDLLVCSRLNCGREKRRTRSADKHVSRRNVVALPMLSGCESGPLDHNVKPRPKCSTRTATEASRTFTCMTAIRRLVHQAMQGAIFLIESMNDRTSQRRILLLVEQV
jgi:hypothetical protein